MLGTLWMITAVLQLTSATRIHSQWQRGQCVTWFTRPTWEYNLAFGAVLLLDLVTFCLMMAKLYSMKRVGIARALYFQHLTYIGISTALNIICMAFLFATLNQIMGYIAAPFTMTISGILGQ